MSSPLHSRISLYKTLPCSIAFPTVKKQCDSSQNGYNTDVVAHSENASKKTRPALILYPFTFITFIMMNTSLTKCNTITAWKNHPGGSNTRRDDFCLPSCGNVCFPSLGSAFIRPVVIYDSCAIRRRISLDSASEYSSSFEKPLKKLRKASRIPGSLT